MKKNSTYQLSFDFLKAKAVSGETFTADDLASAVKWRYSTAEIYLSKKFGEFVKGSKHTGYTANRKILDVSFEAFSKLFAQKRGVFGSYVQYEHGDVTVYEFFLPLSNEDVLRRSLDRLFYKDMITARVQMIGLDKFSGMFAREGDEPDDDFIDRICSFVAEKFGGYSISHVSGRFRASELLDRSAAAIVEAAGDPYLIDETTAVIRFIIPYMATKRRINLSEPVLEIENSDELALEVEKTRFVFQNIFVDAVLQSTTNQAEIWLVESGLQHRIYRFVSNESGDE